MALSVCLRKLEKATSIEDRIPIYKFLRNKKRLPALCSDEKYIVVLTTLLLKDILSENNRILQSEALQTLQSCLCCEHIAELLNVKTSQQIVNVLTDQARTTEHPEMYTEFICALSALVPIMPETMSAKLPEILECLERHFVKQYAPYVDVLSKVCHLFQRLITEIADSMIPHIKEWTPWVFFPLCHQNNEVRDLAMKNLELCIPVFLMMEKTVLPLIVNAVKSHLAKEMTMLFPYQSEYILKLWGNLVTVLGITLHKGSSFINTLLEVVEKAFKSEDEFVLIEAFSAWQNLINNFATNLDVIGNSKRLKLLLQPLKLNFVISERVAVAKCKIWWHIIWSLDDRLNSNFELACIPLLQYAFSSPLKKLDATNSSPATTRSGIKQSSRSSTALGPKSNCIQKLGCEILCRLLEQPKWGSPGGLHSPKKIPNISIMPLKNFVSSNIFAQHISIFAYATKLAIAIFGHDDNCALNQYMLQLLTSRTSRLANDKDQSSLEAISEYFQLISDIVVNKQCKVNQIIKLLEDMKMFPKEQLLNHILKVEYKGKSYNTPVLVILSIMFEPEILKSPFCSDRYFPAFNYFLSVGQSMLAPLSFISSIMEMLKQISPEFSDDSKILCKLWSCICLHLLEIIEKTQEVNEGSGTSCDFTCTVLVLAYPVQYFFTCNILQICDKQLWRNWSNLYKAFARCSALVPSAEANVACEIIAKIIEENVSKKDMHVYSISLTLFQLMQTIVDCIDYPALGKEFSELSSSNWYRREEKPLYNITSFMSLLGNLLSVFSTLVEESQGTERRKDNKQLLEITRGLINIIQKLIVNVNTSSLLKALILKLLPPLVPFFNFKKHRYGKTYSTQFQQSVEALWSSILTSLQLHYSGPYDSEFLESICPLLEINLVNFHQNSVERTRQFWHATFGCNLHNLILPTSFKNVLKKVRPPLIPDIEVSPIEDTSSSLSPNQVSEQIQSNSLNMTRNSLLKKSNGITSCQIPALLSTKKKQILTKTMQHSSNIDHSDSDIEANKLPSVKKPKDKSINSPSRNLLDNSNEKFVVIKPQKKRQILTEHQKEMKGKRSYVPAMYNDLSQQTLEIDTQSFSESSQIQASQEIEILTIPSSTEDIVNDENKVQNEEKKISQELIILSESEPVFANEIQTRVSSNGIDTLNSNHTIEDENLSKMYLSVTLNNSNKESIAPNSEHTSSLPVEALESCLDNKDSDKMNESLYCGNEKNILQEGNLNQTNVIEETENEESMKNDNTQNCIHHISGSNTISDRLLVEDNTRNSKCLTPIKQGMLRLIKNKNRLSSLFPELCHVTLEAESDLDEEDAIPSSQDSPSTMKSNDKSLNKSYNICNIKQQTKEIIPQPDNACIDFNFKVDKKNVAEIEVSSCKTVAKSSFLNDTATQEKKVSQSSEVLLNEIGRVSSSSSKCSSEESVKIITTSCIDNAVSDPKMTNPICSTIDLTGECSINEEENIDLYKQSSSFSQEGTSDYDALQSMQFSISSNNEFQHSIGIIDSSCDSNKSDDAIQIDNENNFPNDSPKFVKDQSNSPEPKRRSLRRLTPTRRVQETLLRKHRSSDIVNYKELFQSRNKLSGNKQQHPSNSSDLRQKKYTTSPTKENYDNIIPIAINTDNFSNNIQHSTALNEKRENATMHSFLSPTVNRVLFPETKQSDHTALKELLTKPLISDCLSERICSSSEDVEVKWKEHASNKNFKNNVADTDESNNNILSTNSSGEIFKECENISLVTEDVNCQEPNVEKKYLENQHKVECIDSEILLKQNDFSPQAEQEQTPELKSPISSTASVVRHSQRQKAKKAGKLKSIELGKLFSETEGEKKPIHEHLSGTNLDSLEAFTSSFEKPKGARKRKNSTPSPSSILTSPVATRLRARNSAAKQRAMQKSHLRGRPKSRSTSLGIAHRHKPKRLSNVSIKSPTKFQPKDEEKLPVHKTLEKEEENLDTTITKNFLNAEEEGEKQDETRKVSEKELSSPDKIPIIENKTLNDVDTTCKDEKIIKTVLPDPSWKRPLTDIKNCRTTQRSFNLPISPLSRSQKILRAAIGNFSSIDKPVPWKTSKYCGSPNKSKYINSGQDNLSPESSKFASSYWAKQSSPIASPSTGILKKRRLTEDHCNTSPSPPQKQRKVSFADPVVQSTVSVESCDINGKPLRSVSRCLEMPKPLTVALSGQQNEMETKDNSSLSETSEDNSSLQTSEEYQITPSNFYDTKEKVFPDLTSCNEPVERILPYLTCSLFPSGLGQLLCARNIFTVGNLCSLTVPELLRLPIRSPKLETVRKALNSYLEIYQKEKVIISTKENINEEKETSLDEIASSENEELMSSVETENNSMEQIPMEKQNCVEESMYDEVEDDISLTPMPDSDSEDSFLSCDETTRRSRLESFSELHKTQSIEVLDDISTKSESPVISQNNQNNQKSVDVNFSNCDDSASNNVKSKAKVDKAETDLAFVKDSSPCTRPDDNSCDEQENQMEIEAPFQLNVENHNVDYKEKMCDDSENKSCESSHVETTKSSGSSPTILVIPMEVDESIEPYDRDQDHLLKQDDYNSSENKNSSSSLNLFSTDNHRYEAEQLNKEANRESRNTADNELKANIDISNVSYSEMLTKSIPNDTHEQYSDSAIENFHSTANTELEAGVVIPNIKCSETEIKSMQNNESQEQYMDIVNEQLHNIPNSDLEINIDIPNVKGSETEIKSVQNDLQKACPDSIKEQLQNIPKSEMEANIDICNVRDSKTEIKYMQNELQEEHHDLFNKQLHNLTNDELEENINISTIKDSEIEMKFEQNDSYKQSANCAILNMQTEVESEFNRENELSIEEEKSDQNSLDKQEESLEKCCSAVEMEVETTVIESSENQIFSFSENSVLARITAIEQSCSYHCDIQEDIIEIVDKLINSVVNEELCERDVNIEVDLHLHPINEPIDKTIANENLKDTTNKTSNVFHIDSGKVEMDKETICNHETVLDINKPTTLCTIVSDCSKRLIDTEKKTMTMQSEEDGDNSTQVAEHKISSQQKEESVIEQSEEELLQSIFTTENLRKVSLLHLVDMMDKLTAAIRIKSEEISHLPNNSRN